MGHSISFGIGELGKRFPEAGGALITQLDQPFVSESHLNNMLSSFRPGNQKIIVSRSPSGWEGVPVLFDRHYFKALLLLGGEEGARKIFKQHTQHVISMESSDILEDMDTPETYAELYAKYRTDC